MSFKSETITHNDEAFEVKEISIKAMMPIMEIIADDPNKGQSMMLAAAVHKDGKPVGDAGLDKIGAGAFLALVEAAMRVNGMGGDGAGND